MTTLTNDRYAQGIHVPSLGVPAVNFWQPGSVADLTADAAASVLLREHADGRAVLCLSDTTRTAKELAVVWRRPAAQPPGASVTPAR
ncbi:polysaccharide lyase beta-sandwich domain-containing protein [Streptomyces xanthophaeus]|uniref:polysaccharide lyase beta-sandwich domain-containing protein n=1 Tax=Streptomyces xanthophaeus TaxID=67385 RepID=UPI00342C144B